MASSFFRNLRRSTASTDTVDQSLVTSLRTNSSFNASLKNIFDNATFNINPTTRRMRMNDQIDMNRADHLLRRGELRNFANETKSLLPNAQAEAGFRTSIRGQTPDLKIREMDDAIVNARRGHSDLDVRPEIGESADQFRARLTPEANRKLDGVLQKIKALAGTSLTVGGVVVIFIVGTDLLQSLIEATNNRRGCFRLTVINSMGTVASCRVLSRTCFDPREAVCDPAFPGGDLNPLQFFPTNVHLVLLRALTDTTLAAQIENELDLTPGSFDENTIITILNDTTYFLQISNFHLTNEIIIPDPCMGDSDTLCRACNPGLPATDLGFVDLSQYDDDTFSMTCIENSSILDTIVDIGIGNGVDLLSSFGRFFTSNSGTIFFLLVIIIIIIVIAVVISLGRKK